LQKTNDLVGLLSENINIIKIMAENINLKTKIVMLMNFRLIAKVKCGISI